ncbi:MAG: hypothetical protein IAG13_34885 [Deltaproteobacteria bacterium]|nr:hypothetical protein [Nannocystaceae bacterium]
MSLVAALDVESLAELVADVTVAASVVAPTSAPNVASSATVTSVEQAPSEEHNTASGIRRRGMPVLLRLGEGAFTAIDDLLHLGRERARTELAKKRSSGCAAAGRIRVREREHSQRRALFREHSAPELLLGNCGQLEQSRGIAGERPSHGFHGCDLAQRGVVRGIDCWHRGALQCLLCFGAGASRHRP